MTARVTAQDGLLRRFKSMFKNAGSKSEGKNEKSYQPASYYYLEAPGKPVWTPKGFSQFAEEAYARNVIAHSCIKMIAQATSSVAWKVFFILSDEKTELARHPATTLLKRPSPCCAGAEFLENLVSYRMISGNAYILAVGDIGGGKPAELHLLRPDRVQVIAGRAGLPAGYRYSLGNSHVDYKVDAVSGQSRVLHLKTFHPLNDWYGMSPVESAAYSIDQHNQAGEWNQALLQNGARPSGALVLKGGEGAMGTLSEEQYYRLRNQIDDHFSGAANAGRPLLLEGGLDWKEMSINPRDMDFINTKHSSARDIALAFGVPPQLLGIPGDNTYSNFQEARLSFWEQTVLPLLDNIRDALNNWLLPLYGDDIQLEYDVDMVPALSLRRDSLWKRASDADFLSEQEKRRMVGLG